MTQTNNHTQRSGFSSGFGVLAATLGSAVGLGNIWMFPYQTGVGGGAGFLLIYLLATLLVGLPLMITEISLGRTTRTDPVNVFRTIAPKTHWWLVGLSGTVAALLIMSFYSVVVGWVFTYVGKGLTGTLLSDDKTHLAEAFGSMVGNPTTSLLMQWLVLLVVGGILLLGVTKGIEAVTKRLMPLLFVLLLIVALTSLSLPNAMAGVKFLFLPDWSKINSTVIFTALGLAFFKLSLGIGSMMIYGSYFRAEQNIPKTALTVMLADLTVSLLAGLAIFPAVFSFGFNPAGDEFTVQNHSGGVRAHAFGSSSRRDVLHPDRDGRHRRDALDRGGARCGIARTSELDTCALDFGGDVGIVITGRDVRTVQQFARGCDNFWQKCIRCL